jgi:hypothetical protein
VRALTTLTKDHEIPVLTADFFDFEYPLPADVLLHSPPFYLFAFFSFVIACLTVLRLAFVQGHQFFVSRPPLPEGGPIQADPVSVASEAPRPRKARMEMMLKIHWRELSRLRRLLLRIQKILVSIGRGSVSRSSFLRVLLLPKLLSGSPLLPMMILKFLTS